MKKNRHDKIIELVNSHEIETQEQLASLLKKEGYDVTQATVSRDIRQLKLTKQVIDGGRQKYVFATADPKAMRQKYIDVLKAGYASIDVAGNLMVLKTVTGMAMALATAIDALDVEGVVGCVAGDDTIFIAVKSNEEAVELTKKFLKVVRDE